MNDINSRDGHRRLFPKKLRGVDIDELYLRDYTLSHQQEHFKYKSKFEKMKNIIENFYNNEIIITSVE